jgi:hypothetical protein
VALRGQIAAEIVGRIDSAKSGGIRTTFDKIPDVPVSRFVLNLSGGSKGLLISSENLCKAPPKASVRLGGQNGKRVSRQTKIRTSCGAPRKAGKR